ncbi:MAG: threonine--tRNA ligase [Candidatus Thermoplasmatota archaeon]|nr:threonine--tRNA ligase [Candidatus Thermoplasmatota archaeon]
MRLLFIHSDFIEYELKEKLKFAEECKDKKKKIEECLVVFTAIEENDEKNSRKIISQACKEIVDVAKTVKADKIVIYPYAHLSSCLASPSEAVQILKNLESSLRELKWPVTRAPFGWYKAFTLKCKGHALSELSKEIKLEEEVTREEILEKIKSDYYILTPDCKEIKVELDKIEELEILKKNDALKKFIYSEELKAPAKEPPSVKAMQRLELVDYEQASDSGHFRFYPKGHLIFKLLGAWASQVAEKLNCLEIGTPILYDWSEKDIKEQAKSFHLRHYVIRAEDRNFVLRFAADFGLFKILKDATISYKNLPFRIYELSKSFRYEQRGELCGLRRLRAFHMPDIHSFTKDLEQGWEEFKELYCNYVELANSANIEYVNAFRVVKEHYESWKPKLLELVKYSKEPAWIEVLSGKIHYWVAKYELQAIDSVGGNTQLCTVQLDLEDASRYGIVYTDGEGKKKGTIICHSSIGSLERWLYAFLEEALKLKKPELPFWLAPTQVRLIPVSNDFLEDCEKLASQLKARADIDDRDEKVARKIRDGEREWIPYIIVFGDRERESGKLPVRLRSGEIKEYSIQELTEELEKKLESYPYEALPLPRLLSKRVVFRG